MKLKDGKKYETADGTVWKVREIDRDYFQSDDVERRTRFWFSDGKSDYADGKDLIRRHYTKPKPLDKLDTQKGDVVRLDVWEDGATALIGVMLVIGNTDLEDAFGYRLTGYEKGERPLFTVLHRASWPK